MLLLLNLDSGIRTGLLNEGLVVQLNSITPNAIIQSSPWGYQNYSISAIYDGISWFRVSDTTGGFMEILIQ